MSVADVGDVIERIEIQGRTASVTPDGGEEYTADLTLYPAKITVGEDKDNNRIELAVKAFDASGNEVGYDTDGLIWAILDDTSDCDVSVNKGIITIDASDSVVLSNFTVKAMTQNNVVDTLRISIIGEGSAAQAGTYYFSDDEEDGSTRLTTIDLEVGAGSLSLSISGRTTSTAGPCL